MARVFCPEIVLTQQQVSVPLNGSGHEGTRHAATDQDSSSRSLPRWHTAGTDGGRTWPPRGVVCACRAGVLPMRQGEASGDENDGEYGGDPGKTETVDGVGDGVRHGGGGADGGVVGGRVARWPQSRRRGPSRPHTRGTDRDRPDRVGAEAGHHDGEEGRDHAAQGSDGVRRAEGDHRPPGPRHGHRPGPCRRSHGKARPNRSQALRPARTMPRPMVNQGR